MILSKQGTCYRKLFGPPNETLNLDQGQRLSYYHVLCFSKSENPGSFFCLQYNGVQADVDICQRGSEAVYTITMSVVGENVEDVMKTIKKCYKRLGKRIIVVNPLHVTVKDIWQKLLNWLYARIPCQS